MATAFVDAMRKAFDTHGLTQGINAVVLVATRPAARSREARVALDLLQQRPGGPGGLAGSELLRRRALAMIPSDIRLAARRARRTS